MSLPVSASVPDLAITVPTGVAAAFGIWFATATAILISEAGVAHCIAKSRLFSAWRALPVSQGRAHIRLEQQSETTRQRSGGRPAHRQPASGSNITRALLRVAAFAFGLGVALPTPAQTISGSSLNITGQSTLQGDVVTCSGHPWIDVRCNGAMADGNHDDTNAINSTISTAIANNWPVRLTAGTYKVTSQITIDYATQASRGFRLISDGAVIDGRTITSGPVLQIQCGGGTTSSPTGCFYFKEEGSLFVNGNTPAYVVVLGKTDFSDAHNSAKFDHLIVNNANTAAAGGGCQFNYVLDSDVYAVCVSAGGAAGLALEQVQFSRISGAGTAAGTGGRGVVLENGFNFSNTFFALDLEVSPTCLSITFSHNGLNTFVSPYFDCVTAVTATASDSNVLINPNYGGATVNYGPLSTGISVIGTGSRNNWLFPAAESYVANPIDDGLSVSNFNAPGASMSVTLPAVSTVNAGWSMGFASDNGKGMTITTTSGSIVSGGKSLDSITIGAGNYEYVRLQSDGNNFRIVSSTRNTRLANGFEPPPWPSNWLFPASSGYAAGLSDNGNVLSSYNSASGLMVTLPSTNGIPDGWSMGFATDNNKALTVQVNGATGGHIVWPGSGGSQTSLAMANTSQGAYEFMVLQYDGNGIFRVLEATPATAQAIGMIGAAGISHWSFPTVSSYAATVADNGNVISSLNSTASYLAITLPSTTAVPMGWTIGIATDGNKTAAVQTNSISGGRILYPGSGATTTSASLAAANYELLILQFDGGNFRVIQATPATATLMGISGNAPGINRWSFPAVGTYAASQSDIGNALSSYNTPTSSLTVTLPPTTAISSGWTMGFATDNGKTITVQVNGASGGRILYPAGATGSTGNSVTLAPVNYEFMALQFDGSNFRIVSITPRSASALGMFGHQITTGATPAVGSGSTDCGTSPSIGGNDSAGRVTVGSTNGGSCTITFVSPWPNPPVCSVFDETRGTLVRPMAASTATVALTGPFADGDVLAYQCVGFQ
jgi:Pectate lyase superfamily protein